MKKIIYLHIGTFKTGTSSIQHYLKNNSNWLEAQGYFFPKTKLIGHHDLPISLIKEFTQFREPWPAFKGNWKEIWEDVFSQIKSTSCNKIIISSENFCDLVNEHARSNTKKIAEVLTHYFKPYEVKVVAYIRKLDLYVSSMYKETVKVGNETSSLEEVLKLYLKHKSIHVHPSVYLDFFSSIFDKKNIATKLYSTDLFENGDVVMDFLSFIGVTVSGKPTEIKVQSNVSLSENATELKRIYNIFGAHDYEHNKNIYEILAKVDNIASNNNEVKLNPHDKDKLNFERDYLLNNYNIDIGTFDDILEFENGRLPKADAFIISLLAMTIKQNLNIMNKINNIEKTLLGLNLHD